MLDDKSATPGVLPMKNGVADPARTLSDVNAGDETFSWSTPATKIPDGSIMVRIEAYRKTEPLHYAQHMTKVYVDR